MNLLHKLEVFFFSDHSKKRIEKIILYIALIGFFIHLLLIFLTKENVINLFSTSGLFKNPISAIYTPFSFILIYEVYLLIYYLPRSFTTYITKQYEIITLIIIRKLFKDLANLKLSSDWFHIKGDLQFTYDLMASIILFYLIYLFVKQGSKRTKVLSGNKSQFDRFIRRKKIIAVFLVPIFISMAIITLFNWLSGLSLSANNFPGFDTINNLFFDEFFTVLILVDVVLLLISFFYTDQFNKIMRNSGFVVSTILIRISFGVQGLISTVLILVAVIFGLAIITIHNKFEENTNSKNLN
jgi:hypothetical protein